MENEIKHSENFITNKIGKLPNFSVPRDYFNEIDQDISAKIIAENFDKKPAFEVPKSYFEGLENQILKNTTPNKTTKVISFKDRLIKAIPYVAAACIVFFIGLNTFVFSSDKKLNFDTVSDSEIEYWLSENSISTNELAVVLEDVILEENIFSLTNIEDESFEDYINSIDNTSLLNELN